MRSPAAVEFSFGFSDEVVVRLCRISGDGTDARNRYYLETYPDFLGYFASLDLADDDRAYAGCRIGLVLVYSWMGRGEKKPFDPAAFTLARPALIKARHGEDLTQPDLEHIRAFTSKSMVAASKFLHFLCPARFPMWDRWVARTLKFPPGRVEDCALYLQYARWLRQQPMSPRAEALVCSHLCLEGPDHALRAKEYVLFMHSRSAGQ